MLNIFFPKKIKNPWCIKRWSPLLIKHKQSNSMKNSPNMKLYFLPFLILSTNLYSHVTSSTSDNPNCIFTRRFEVHVVNMLPNSPPMTVHCKSRDDDLGEHTVVYWQDYNFHFCTKLIFTLFWCRIKWQSKNIAFDVFSGKWFPNRCATGICYWAAKEDGIYFADELPPNLPEKVHPW